MDNPEDFWKKEVGKLRVVQKCPKCGNLSLKYIEGKLICSDCGFEQSVGKVIK